MSERGDALRKLIHSGTKEAAVRAVILYNSDMISDEFRLKVLREEIRSIEERIASQGPGAMATVRRQLRWSEGLGNKVRESESPAPQDGEG